MSSALAEVVSELDEAMFDPANMVVTHYLTHAGVVIAAVHSTTPANAGAVPHVPPVSIRMSSSDETVLFIHDTLITSRI